MEENLGIKALEAIHTYDLDEIATRYDALAGHFGITLDYNTHRAEADAALKSAKDAVGDVPVAIDYQAVRKPFTLAKVLLQYGFNVRFLMTDGVKNVEKAAAEYVKANYPQVEIVNAVHHDMVNSPIRDGGYLCIGFDCAYATGSDKVLNLMEDEGLFGFDGVKELMRLLVEANEAEADLKEIIEEAKLII